MRRAILMTGFVLAGLSTARAEPAAPIPTDLLEAALTVLQGQRNAALDQGAQAQAELTLARRDVARLRAELEEAKKPKPAEPQAPAEPAARTPAEPSK